MNHIEPVFSVPEPDKMYSKPYALLTAVFAVLFSLSSIFLPLIADAQNPIVTENALPGNPPSEWDIDKVEHINYAVGFADNMSYQPGEQVNFRIKIGNNTGLSYWVKIYRLGWYGGNGARLIADLGQFTPVDQTDPDMETGTGLMDFSNWSITNTWTVPANATPGVYIAYVQLAYNRDYASHIPFVVRNDGSTAPILFKTSDATWQAYNIYGGVSSYQGDNPTGPSGRSHKVSYNRPFLTRDGGASGSKGRFADWLFNAEYPMIRFLERNGYDVTYTTDVDMDRDNTPITPAKHKVFLSVGHDEYWSLNERNRVEAARDAGVHLAFFSGNEVYWKIRWEDNHRTMVCYKEGSPINGIGENMCNSNCDPSSIWTGLWRAPEGDANRPENQLTGQISWEDTMDSIVAVGKYAPLRLWRNTPVAGLGGTGVYQLSRGSLGYEWSSDRSDFDWAYPHGKVQLTTTENNEDFHHLVLFKHRPSNALIFGAGSIQFTWGLDSKHDPVQEDYKGLSVSNPATQQFTINLLAEMGATPATLMPGMTAATAFNDQLAPSTTISQPANNATFQPNTPIVISGTSTDNGNGAMMGGMEISVDGGTTWNRLPDDQFGSTINWTYTFTPSSVGTYTVKLRGFDDMGNLENPDGDVPALTRTIIVSNAAECLPLHPTLVASSTTLCPTRPVELSITDVAGTGPYTIIVNGDTYNDVQPDVPFTTLTQNSLTVQNVFGFGAGSNIDETRTDNSIFNPQPVEVGMKFRAAHDGFIQGVRYYHTGLQMSFTTHIGKLYNEIGQLLAIGTFTTGSGTGWRGVTFSTPVEISANATYVVTVLHDNGYYARTQNFFTTNIYNASNTLWGVANSEGVLNGVIRQGANPSNEMPTASLNSSNYWVDVNYLQKADVNTTVYNLTSITDANTCNQVNNAPAISSVTIRSSESCEALPVRFLSFTGRLQGENVVLNWSTAMESINDKFVIERSKDGNNFKSVGEVKGNYNSTVVQYYTFTDPSIEPGTYQYRLRQVDVNGNFSFSNAITITLLGGNTFQLSQNNPNPLTTTAAVEYYVPYTANVNITLMDINGKPLKQLANGQKMKGRYVFSLSKGNLAAGVYLYRLTADNNVSITRKLIIQ